MAEYYGIPLLPIIIGLVAVIKRLLPRKYNPQKFAPLISVIIGILMGVFYVSSGNLKDGMIIGTMLGLSASGLYSGTKNTMEKIRR